jgi:pimeloyl-ACP methyl ester carboxylesterase
MSISEALGEQHEVNLPRGTIRYRDRGQGPPIVFVHGALVNGDLWRKVVPELAKDFRCITPDLPLGSHELPMPATADLSPPAIAAMIPALLEALGVEDVTLVGNDTGGALCQMAVTQRPERIGRLVLTNCDGFEVFPPKLFEWVFATAKLPGGTFVLAQTMRFRPLRRLPLAYGWLSKGHPEPAVSDGWTAPARTNPAVRRDLTKFLRSIDKQEMLAAARKLGSFERPVLLAWADDRFFPMELARRIAAAFPNARIAEVPDSRTFVPEDQPDVLAGLIAGFARERRPEAAAPSQAGA